MTQNAQLQKYYKTSAINLIALLIGFGLIFLRGNQDSQSSLVIELGLFVLSLILLVRAADIFTDVAVIVGKSLGLSKLNTGILIIAIGTSAPELFASIGAALQNQPEIVVGNVLGTVIANCLLAIGFAAIVAKQPLDVHREVLGSQMSVYFIAVLLTSFALYDGQFTRLEGVVLLVVLGFYLRHNISHSSDASIDAKQNLPLDNNPAKDRPDQDKPTHQPSLPMTSLIVLLFIGLACLFLSGDFVVSSLSNGADIMGLSSAKLATSLLAIGTSIPEIATAIILVRKNNTDSLFGEIIGSNIFDYLGIFGIISIFKPIVMQGALLTYLLLASFATFCITWVIMSDRKIRHVEGVALLALFAGFLLQLLEI